MTTTKHTETDTYLTIRDDSGKYILTELNESYRDVLLMVFDDGPKLVVLKDAKDVRRLGEKLLAFADKMEE